MENNVKSEASSSKENPADGSSSEARSSQFECNICLDTACDAVISHCGHLFCWPCLNTWLETRPTRQECPVCKAGINKDKVVPLYGRGSTSRTDPRTKHPPRPQAQRSEPETQNRNFPGFSFGDGSLRMSFGIGAFPFAFFGAMFNLNDSRPPPNQDSPYYEEEQSISKAFLWLAVLLFFWMLIA